MRFPWLQLESDFLEARAGDLAALLGISRYEAIGRVADVWAWALNRAPKESPPDGRVDGEHAECLVEAAAGWTCRAKRGAFVRAALEVGLLERTDTGLRVRGMSRYATAHGNAQARSEKARLAAEARWAKEGTTEAEPEHAPSMQQASAEHAPSNADAMPGDAKTQTQTQTQTKTSPPSREPMPPKAPEAVEPPLIERMLAAWERHRSYALEFKQRRDGDAMRELLAKPGATEAEIERRWGNALGYVRFPVCGGLPDLVRHWDRYGQAESAGAPPRPGAGPPADVRRGAVRAEDARARMEPPGEVQL